MGGWMNGWGWMCV